MRQRFRAPWPRFVLAVTVTGFLAAAPAFPSGFQVQAQGAKAIGMGLARMHRTDTWRGICAVLTPIFLLCCCGVAAALAIPALLAMGR